MKTNHIGGANPAFLTLEFTYLLTLDEIFRPTDIKQRGHQFFEAVLFSSKRAPGTVLVYLEKALPQLLRTISQFKLWKWLVWLLASLN